MKLQFFTEELFLKTINNIEKQLRADDLNRRAMDIVFKDIEPYDNTALFEAIMSVMQHQLAIAGWGFPKGLCPIEYFCHELDFGKKENTLITINNVTYNLKTAKDLWQLINNL
ncbi:MAG: hypothetical protein HC896_00385 [Bacteroidales bacterium]|nr:hypothetical protein [Bacteroidales bacterium]